jgi:hypothetical protein
MLISKWIGFVLAAKLTVREARAKNRDALLKTHNFVRRNAAALGAELRPYCHQFVRNTNVHKQ